MANAAILRSIVQLAQRLGAKPGKFGGTRSNITFLGSGPSNELFSQSLRINELPGLFGAGGKLKPAILDKVNSGVSYAMAGKLSSGQLRTLDASLKAMDNLQSGLTKPTGIINTESFRMLGRRGAKGSEFKELGQRLKAQRTQGFKEAMEAADDLILEGSGGTITRTDLKNLSPEALQNLRLEFAPDIMTRFFKPKLAGGGRIGFGEGTPDPADLQDFSLGKDAEDFLEFLRLKERFNKQMQQENLLEEFMKFQSRDKPIEVAKGGLASLDKPKRGLVDEPGSYAGKTLFGDIAEIDIGESLKQTGSGFLNLFSPSQIMELLSGAGEGFKQIYFNLKSNAEKEDLLNKIIGNQFAKGGMVKDKGLAKILEV